MFFPSLAGLSGQACAALLASGNYIHDLPQHEPSSVADPPWKAWDLPLTSYGSRDHGTSYKYLPSSFVCPPPSQNHPNTPRDSCLC